MFPQVVVALKVWAEARQEVGIAAVPVSRTSAADYAWAALIRPLMCSHANMD